MKHLSESSIPEPRRYDERFCSGKRIHHLRQAYEKRNPPSPKKGWWDSWPTDQWANGTRFAVPTRRRRWSSMIARACAAQVIEQEFRASRRLVMAQPPTKLNWYTYHTPRHYKRIRHLFAPRRYT